MCWFCNDIKKFINKSVVVYDDATASTNKEYCHIYSKDTVTLKVTAGYKGNSYLPTGMRELKGLKYCPNCGEKIGGSDDCTAKENDKISCGIEKLKRDVKDLKKEYEEVKEPKSLQLMIYEHMASKAIAEREFKKRYRDIGLGIFNNSDIVNLYERLAKGGIECSITVDDKNGICTIYSHGIELADDSEAKKKDGYRINESFEDVLEEEEE